MRKRGLRSIWNDDNQIMLILKATNEEYQRNKIRTDQHPARTAGKEVTLNKQRLWSKTER